MPAPASLIVFGSFAGGEADSESDIDVLAVRPLGLRDDDEWTDALWAWTSVATRVAGNPVNVIEAAAEEIPGLLRRPGPSVWTDIVRDGDAVCAVKLQTVWRGDHVQAVSHLELAGGDGKQAARQLSPQVVKPPTIKVGQSAETAAGGRRSTSGG